jgi:hypothetical protein
MDRSGTLWAVGQPSPVRGELRRGGLLLAAPQLGDHALAQPGIGGAS